MADEAVPGDTQWRAFVRQFTRRLRFTAREAPGQAMGILSLCVVLLALAALSGRTAYLLFTEYYEAVQAQVSSITRQAEPRSDLEYPAVTSAVLAPVNANLSKWSIDSLAPANGHRARAILRTAQLLMETAVDAGAAGPDVTDPTLSATIEHIGREAGFARTAGWTESALEHVRMVHDAPLGSVRAIPPDSTLPVRVRLQGPFGTELGARLPSLGASTTLLIPSTFLLPRWLLSSPEPRERSGVADSIRHEMLTAVAVSRLLEDALSLCLPPDSARSGADENAPEIVQAYFISDRSVLRIWPAQDPNQLGVNRYWAAAHYMQQFYSKEFEGKDWYESPPYIDLGGNGIVRTMCQTVSAAYRQRPGRLVGIVAVDYRLPTTVYLDSLAEHNMLFELHQMAVPSGSTLGDVTNEEQVELLRAARANGRRHPPHKPRWGPARSGDRARLLDLARQYAARVTPAEARSRLGLLRGFPDPVFILPLARGPGGAMRFLLLEPRTPRLPADVYAYGLLGIVLLVTASGLLVWWNRHATGELERLRQATFIRNLQCGVIRVDADGYIVEANQVCEWLFGVTMEQHGERAPDLRGRRKFRDLIGDWIIPADPARPHSLGERVERFVDHEAKHRGRLESTSYFAFTRPRTEGDPEDPRESSVLFISGGPIIQQPPAHLRRPFPLAGFGLWAAPGGAEGGRDFRVQTGGVVSRVTDEATLKAARDQLAADPRTRADGC